MIKPSTFKLQHNQYSSLRQHFLDSVPATAHIQSFKHPLPGPNGEELFCDVVILGSLQATKWMVTLSGTHGVEGYYGSMSQARWLQELSQQELPADTAVLFIHLINPWGVAHLRRTNEDNIDLNRNYIDFATPVHNTHYADLHQYYDPANLAPECREATNQARQQKMDQMGVEYFMDAVEAGQYTHPDGVYYGGVQPSWSNKTLRHILATYLNQAREVISMDLHTGAGPYGLAMLLSVSEYDYPGLQAAKNLFGAWLIPVITTSNQLSKSGISGSVTGYTSKMFIDSLPHAKLMQLVVECGTYNHSIGQERLLEEHYQTSLTGTNKADQPALQQARTNLFEYFFPNDQSWEDMVWWRTQQIFRTSLNHLLNNSSNHV